MKFLRWHVRQKALLLLFSLSLSLFLLPVTVFGRTYKSFFAYISSIAMQDGVDTLEFIGHTDKRFRQGCFNCEISYVRI